MQQDINALRKDVDATQNNIIALTQDKLNVSDYTAQDVLSKILTVDGAGSGLDADKLDGVELSSIYAKYDMHNLGTSNLNSITTPGIYGQNQNANATSGNNYPNTSSGAGILEVFDIYNSGFIIQRYTTYYGHQYIRFYKNWDPVGWQTWTRSNIRSGSVTVANVTANTIGTVAITLSDQPPSENIVFFTWGGTQGDIQLNNRSGSTFTIQYKFEATATNRAIAYIYYI